jgi:hypothetical protein
VSLFGDNSVRGLLARRVCIYKLNSLYGVPAPGQVWSMSVEYDLVIYRGELVMVLTTWLSVTCEPDNDLLERDCDYSHPTDKED